uniref:DUF2637 domain-containing protein n=1 Tax=Nonomuraea sp. CA-251285 TaxID=3240002 RepID=UPI003F49AEF0
MTVAAHTEEALTPPAHDRPARVTNKLRLTPMKIAAGIVVGLLVAALAAYGGAGSYETIKALAEKHKVPLAHLVPVGIDGALLGVIVMDLFFTWLGQPSWILRLSARFFTIGTVVVNGLAAVHDERGPHGEIVQVINWTAMILHVFAPVVLLVMCEAVRKLLLDLIADDDQDDGYEKLGWVCWLTRPGPSFMTWKRMRISRIRRYADAEDFEARRRGAVARLRIRYGKKWRSLTRADLVWGLRTVTREDALLALLRQVSALTGPGGEPSRASRNPSGTPFPEGPENPRPSTTGNPSGTPGGGRPGGAGNPAGTPGGGRPGGAGNGSAGDGNGGRSRAPGNPGAGAPDAGARNPSDGNGGNGDNETQAERFHRQMGHLREAFPDRVPGINLIKTTVGGGYENACSLQKSLKVERGIPLEGDDPDTDGTSDPLLAGIG